jgi:hypothetical protein
MTILSVTINQYQLEITGFCTRHVHTDLAVYIRRNDVCIRCQLIRMYTPKINEFQDIRRIYTYVV